MTAPTILADGLTFDAEAHRYTRGGLALASVTGILDDNGLVPGKEFFTEHARLRGTYVHAATHLIDAGTLDYDTLDPEVAAYSRGWETFKEEQKFEPLLSEVALDHPTRRFAGTLDRIGLMPSRPGPILLDIKTGGWSPQYDLQLAAYAILVEANAHLIEEAIGVPLEGMQRMTLVLTRTSAYRQKPPAMRDTQARHLFLAALNLYHFRKELHHDRRNEPSRNGAARAA